MMDETLIRAIESRVRDLEFTNNELRHQIDVASRENLLLREVIQGLRAEIEIIRRDREYSP
jgi:hypothetical protein